MELTTPLEKIGGVTYTHRRGGGVLVTDKVLAEECYIVACESNKSRDCALIKCVTGDVVTDVQINQKNLVTLIGKLRGAISLGLPRYDEDLVRIVYNFPSEYSVKPLKEYQMPTEILSMCGIRI